VAGNKDGKGSEMWEGGKSVFATDMIFFFRTLSIRTAVRRPVVFPSSGKESTYTGGPLRDILFH